MFLNIPSNRALNVFTCFLNLKTSNDNNNPDSAIVMQENGCSGIVKHIRDVHSMFLPV